MSSARSRSPFLKPGQLVLALGWYSGVVLGGTGLTDGMGVLNINVLVSSTMAGRPGTFL